MIDVIRPGLFTTVQDDGRWGHQRFGVPVSGPMDRLSHRRANRIVLNQPTCATLEVTLVGPQLEFTEEVVFVVTGAVFDLTVDDVPVAHGVSHTAGPGQRLSFGARRRGARAYVGVAGGIDVPVVLGSRATHVGSKLGGVEGRALRAGDRISVGDDRDSSLMPLGTPYPGGVVLGDGGASVRVILGPHDDRFGATGIETLKTSRFVVSVNADRMGFRLSGPPIASTTTSELLSAPVETGAIQVPPSGDPIILMADHQTTGGYPRIGTVITADVPVVAQLAPSDWIEFTVCDHEEAMKSLIDQERWLVA